MAIGHREKDRERTFVALFELTYEPLQRYVARRAPVAAVDDVVADVLATVWRRLDDVPSDSPLPWMYGIARNTLFNVRRSTALQGRLVGRLTSERSVGASEASGSLIVDALDSLSDEEQEILRLSAWEQLAPREIAASLGITANAASIRLHRARRNLKIALGSPEEVTS
jgi:RNA polymerase sigma-70 factor (ECF subfamily)